MSSKPAKRFAGICIWLKSNIPPAAPAEPVLAPVLGAAWRRLERNSSTRIPIALLESAEQVQATLLPVQHHHVTVPHPDLRQTFLIPQHWLNNVL